MAAHLDQEAQVEIIKKFWRRYGVTIILSIILVAIGVGGWRFWQTHHQNKIYEASKIYQMVVYDFANEHDTLALGKVTRLLDQHPKSVYASLAALFKAQYQVNKKEYPEAAQTLEWVIEHTKSDAIMSISKLRLARVLLGMHQPEAALQALDISDAQYSAAQDALKGQAYEMLGENAKAKIAIKQAIDKLSTDSSLTSDFQLQLYALPVSNGKQEPK